MSTAASGPAGSFIAPRTRRGPRLRNLAARSAWVMRGVVALTDRLAARVELRDYPAFAAPR